MPLFNAYQRFTYTKYKQDMNRKALLISLVSICFTASLIAQGRGGQPYTPAPSKNEFYVKDKMWSISVGGGAQMYVGEDDNKVSFNKRLTVAPTITVARRLSSVFSARLQVTGGTLHGYNDGWAGTYTKWDDKASYYPDKATLDPQWEYMGWKENEDYVKRDGDKHYVPIIEEYNAENKNLYLQTIHYIGFHGDLSVALINALNGYQPYRRFEISPFLSLGVYQRFAHRGNLSSSFVGIGAGANISVRLDDNWGLFAEGRGMVVNDTFDGEKGSMSNNGIGSLTAGVTYHFGTPRYIDPALDKRYSIPYSIVEDKDKMVLVPGGNIEIGAGFDPVWCEDAPTKLVSVSPFWMDQTEVTNKQYREFVYYVRDSIIRERLADPAFGNNSSYLKANKYGELVLNWGKPIPWRNATQGEAAAISSVMQENGNINPKALFYRYNRFDSHSYYACLDQLSKGVNSVQIAKDTAYVDREGYIVRRTITRDSRGSQMDFTNTYITNVYPDEMSWATDFPNSKNDQYVGTYFASEAYNNHPVLGVSWTQADAFCAWRTEMYLASGKSLKGFTEYRLPSEAEWEYAARDGRSEQVYPWLSEKTHTSDGLAHLNYRGSTELKDLVMQVGAFLPNRFGLYDMSGNAAEWTASTYVETVDNISSPANPNFDYRASFDDPAILKRKVVKGGSWKDTGAFVNPGVKTFEQQDRGRSYIGFRCIRSWVSTEKK